MSYKFKRLTKIASKVFMAAAAVISATGTSMAYNAIDVLAAPTSTYSDVEITAVTSEGETSSLDIHESHEGETFHATTGVTDGAISASAGDILPVVPEVSYTNASFDVKKETGSYVTVVIVGSSMKDGDTEETEFTHAGIITHGSSTDNGFRQNIANRTSGLISELPNIARDVLGPEYVNENLKAKSVEFIYYTARGTQNSSDFQREVKYHVTGTEAGTHKLDNTTEILEIGDTVKYPAYASTDVFDGWYLDEEKTIPFSGVVDVNDFEEGEVTDIYGSIILNDGATVNYTVYAYDTSTGTVESGNATPIEGVTVTLTRRGNLPATGNSKTTDAEGKATFQLQRGNWIIAETALPDVPGSSITNPMIYTEAEPSWVQILYASGTLETTSHNFLHDILKSINVHFELDGGVYPEPIVDQQTAKGGLVIYPGTPTKEVDGVPYTFLGWFKDGATEPYDFTSEVTETSSFTLTARWAEPKMRTVSVVFSDVNPTQPQDLSGNNFDVKVYDSVPMTPLKDEEGHSITDIIATLISNGYLKEHDSDTYSNTATYGQGQDETITVKMIHRVDNTNGGATETNPERTIHYIYEDGSEAAPDVVQPAIISTVAPGIATDAVTGEETETEGQTIVKNGWSKVTSPIKNGYRADVPSVGEVTALDELVDGTEVTVTYAESPTIADVTVTLIGHNEEIGEYDGEEHTLEGYEVVITDETQTYTEDDFTYSGPSSVTGKNAGVYSLGLDVRQLVNENENYNVRFAVKQGYLTINRRHVTVTPDDKTKLEGDPDPEFTATVEGLLGDDTIQYTLSRADGTHPVTKHPIYVNCVRIQGNYYVDTRIGILTIESSFVPSEKPIIPIPPEDDHGYIAWHTDRDDADQTVTFPGIRTTAKDITDDVTYDDKDDFFFIEDVVEYTGLTPNKRYTMKGTLMDKISGTAIAVEPVTKQFRPTEPNGSVVLEFKVPRELVNGTTVVVFEDCLLNGKTVAIHADLEDADQTVLLVEKTMRTTAKTTSGDGKTIIIDGISETVKMTDTIAYTGLVPNRNYTVSGTIHINIDGVDAGTLKNALGEDITATKIFAPTESAGSVDVEFEFDSDLITKGMKLVVFEELYEGSIATEEPILTHEDIDDEDQTVTVDESQISIRTTATGKDGAKTVTADTAAEIVDKIVYAGLTAGETYDLKGELHLVNLDGTDGGVIATGEIKNFKPETAEGTVDMNFKFDAHELSGRSVVVFEYLYKGELLIAKHEDIADEDQTVVVKQFSTTAVNYYGKAKTISNKRPAAVDDTIQYSGLTAGQTYEAVGEMRLVRGGVDMGTYIDADGKEVTSSVKFTAAAGGSGNVVVPFDFIARNLIKDDKVVVFETIYLMHGEDREYIGEHKDINDKDQTVTVVDHEESDVEIHTTATVNGEKSFVAGTNATIKDYVEILDSDKIAGLRCVLEGELHIRKNGADGGKVGNVIRKDFTVPIRAETPYLVEMEFTGIDLKSYPAGTEFVVFEKLYRLDGGIEVLLAEHADIDDEDQTVTAVESKPSIRTTATGENGKTKIVSAAKDVKIVDTVTYENLIPGKEYTLTGSLHLIKNGKDEKILQTENLTFKPTSANGSVKITFTVDTSALNGRRLVVFEELYEGRVKVASHADINDKDQTVTVEDDVKPTPTPTPKPTPTPTPGLPSYEQNTGTGYGVFAAFGLMVAAAVGLAVMYRKKK